MIFGPHLRDSHETVIFLLLPAGILSVAKYAAESANPRVAGVRRSFGFFLRHPAVPSAIPFKDMTIRADDIPSHTIPILRCVGVLVLEHVQQAMHVAYHLFHVE